MNLPSIPSLALLSSLPDLLASKIPDDMKTMAVTQRHMLIVSHAVPLENVSAQLPPGFEPDTLKINGQSRAIVQMVCHFNDNFHYSPLVKPSFDFWQLTYRVLLRRAFIAPPAPVAAPTGAASTGANSSADDSQSATGASWATSAQATAQALFAQASAAVSEAASNVSFSPSPNDAAHDASGDAARRDPGVYVWKTFLGTRTSWVVQRAVASRAEHADFNVITRGAPERGEYASYIVDAQPSDALPPTQIAARTVREQVPVAPFANWDKMIDFLTRRPNAYQQVSLGENVMLLPSQFALMHPSCGELIPVGGEVREARMGVWEQMGLMTPDEMRRPFSVLLQSELPCTMGVPNYFLKNAPPPKAP